MLLKIGMIGTGNMGRALGLRFALAGHDVKFGGRDPDASPADASRRARELLGKQTSFGTLSEAAQYGNLLLWTPRERDPIKVFPSEFDLTALKGKIVVDLNNRDYAEDVIGPDPKWFTESLGEQLQSHFPESNVVRCFNIIPMGMLDAPREELERGNAQVFIAAQVVEKLAGDVGFDSVQLGGSKTAMRAIGALGDIIRFVLIDRGIKAANIGITRVESQALNIVGPRVESLYR